MRALLSAALAFALIGVAGAPAAAKDAKPKKPKLEVRAVPMMAMAPVEVLLLIDLKGGDDLEEYYCPEIEVLWDDGGKSSQEADCPPFQPGTAITRHYSLSHEYRNGGEFEVRVRLRRAERIITSTQVRVSVRPPLGGGF
jgi:hypothetical protein